jgi:primosomal protein N' (replication factor Y)
MAAPRFAQVALPIPVDQEYTYSIPLIYQDVIEVGMRVVVPFGRRRTTGYVVKLIQKTDREDIRPLHSLPDSGPVFSDEMLSLCRWMADYYCCSTGEALQCTLPSGISIGSEKVYTLKMDAMSGGRFTPVQKQIVHCLYTAGAQSEKELSAKVADSKLASSLTSLVKRDVLDVELREVSEKIKPKVESWAVLKMDAVLGGEAQAALQRKAPKQAQVYLDLLRNETEQPYRSIYEKHGVSSAIIQALVEKGLVLKEQREIYRSPISEISESDATKPQLNVEQKNAYESITKSVSNSEYATYLLQGITGSGKTEVYLQSIEYVLAHDRNALILVPEISLTPQTVGRFKMRFGEAIAVLHSGLSSGERFDEWRRVLKDEVRIVVGARSAIFAPLKDIGIIVVDEEHDTSYKQTDTPRYHARDVAIMRAHQNNAVCVLGSATPSIESYHNSETKKSIRLELLTRATESNLPEVQLVDMRRETKEQSGEVILSQELEKAIFERIKKQEQVILLLNRRGHAPFVMCPSCGWSADCENCNVSLTFHSRGNHLTCHYCNAQRAAPPACDECGHDPLIYLGAGTQKIEDYLQRSFPGARVARMDRDTTSQKGSHAKILERFSRKEIDILVGTQMIAKGHDYPGVTLVGVVNADTGLTLPDFRAAESGFQLLTQVAGRAGRGDKPGIVLIQTYRPNHYAVQASSRHDYGAFYEQEIEYRRSAGYPPFRRMVNFCIESPEILDAEKGIAWLHRTVREQREALGLRSIELLGPAPAAIYRLNKKYRWNLGALCKSGKNLNILSRAVREVFEAPSRNTALKIDLDPYGLF